MFQKVTLANQIPFNCPVLKNHLGGLWLALPAHFLKSSSFTNENIVSFYISKVFKCPAVDYQILLFCECLHYSNKM